MLLDLDKEYLRDLKITALGDIISILKHARHHHDKTTHEAILNRERDTSSEGSQKEESPPPPKSRFSSKPQTNPAPAKISFKDNPGSSKISSSGEQVRTSKMREELDRTSRIEQELLRARISSKAISSVKTSKDKIGKESMKDISEPKSVFSRLGGTAGENDNSMVKPEVKEMRGGSIFERLGRQDDEERSRRSRREDDQEPRVTSTSEDSNPALNRCERASASPGRGILKKRAAGEVGSALQKSKSAPNIISLKAPVREKNTKRISFGEIETRTMAPKDDIRSRLGYGRQASPPPEVIEPQMQTKIQKIALGGGKFEMRKVMKMVKTELGKDDLSRPEVKAESDDTRFERTSSRMSSAGVFAMEGVSKLKISVKNDPKPQQMVVKKDLQIVAKRSADLEEEPVRKSKKRLAMYRTLADGTVEKEYIGYDNPILAKVPIQKRKSEDLASTSPRRASSVTITKDKTASNFQVVRRPSAPLYSGQEKVVTLAEKAKEMRSRAEGEGRGFETLATRAQRRRSPSPVVDRSRGRMVDRLGEEVRDRSPLHGRLGVKAEGKQIFSRLGPKY